MVVAIFCLLQLFLLLQRTLALTVIGECRFPLHHVSRFSRETRTNVRKFVFILSQPPPARENYIHQVLQPASSLHSQEEAKFSAVNPACSYFSVLPPRKPPHFFQIANCFFLPFHSLIRGDNKLSQRGRRRKNKKKKSDQHSLSRVRVTRILCSRNVWIWTVSRNLTIFMDPFTFWTVELILGALVVLDLHQQNRTDDVDDLRTTTRWRRWSRCWMEDSKAAAVADQLIH